MFRDWNDIRCMMMKRGTHLEYIFVDVVDSNNVRNMNVVDVGFDWEMGWIRQCAMLVLFL